MKDNRYVDKDIDDVKDVKNELDKNIDEDNVKNIEEKNENIDNKDDIDNKNYSNEEENNEEKEDNNIDENENEDNEKDIDDRNNIDEGDVDEDDIDRKKPNHEDSDKYEDEEDNEDEDEEDKDNEIDEKDDEDNEENEDIEEDEDIDEEIDIDEVVSILGQLEKKKEEYLKLRNQIKDNLNYLEEIDNKLNELEDKILKEKNEGFVEIYKDRINKLIEERNKIIQVNKENIEEFLSFFKEKYKDNKRKFEKIEDIIVDKEEKTDDDRKILLSLRKIDKYNKILDELATYYDKFDIDLNDERKQTIYLENKLYQNKIKEIKNIEEFKKKIKEYELFLLENWKKLGLWKEEQKEILVELINDFKERQTNEKRIVKEVKNNIKDNINEVKQIVTNNKAIEVSKKIKENINKLDEWILKKYSLTDYSWDYNDLLLDFFIKFIIFMVLVYFIFKIDFIAQFTKTIYWI